MRRFRKFVILPFIALIAACGGKVYNLPADEAQAKLTEAEPPLEMAEGLHDRIAVARTTDGGVMWVLTNSAGVAIAQAWATIEPSGDNAAEITLDETTLDSSGDATDPKLFELFRLAIREHVDSTLTNRQFEIAALGPDMMGEFVNQSFQQTSKELENDMGSVQTFPPAINDQIPESDGYGNTFTSDETGFAADAPGAQEVVEDAVDAAEAAAQAADAGDASEWGGWGD